MSVSINAVLMEDGCVDGTGDQWLGRLEVAAGLRWSQQKRCATTYLIYFCCRRQD